MKKYGIMMAIAISVMVLSSCGGSKGVAMQDTTPKKVKLALDECQELAAQKPEQRAWGEGINFSLSSATNAAELQARARFARAIAAKIKAAEENSGFSYRQSSTDTQKSATVGDLGAKYNEDQMSIAEETIKNTVIIKTSQYMMQDGSYQVFVCMEYKEGVAKMAEEITNKVKQRVSDEDRMKMEFEFSKFRERMQEELKRMNTNEE